MPRSLGILLVGIKENRIGGKQWNREWCLLLRITHLYVSPGNLHSLNLAFSTEYQFKPAKMDGWSIKFVLVKWAVILRN